MPLSPDVIKLLSKKEDNNKFHEKILDHVKRLVKRSRSKMSEYYEQWDVQDHVFRGERCPDLEDRKQMQKGKPEKMIVPNTYAQVMTFTSFLFLMFNQNQKFLELVPSGWDDHGTKKEDSETLLDRDLRRNNGSHLVYQALLDTGRFGLGIVEDSWTKETMHARVRKAPVLIGQNGSEASIGEEFDWQQFTKFEGNELKSVSPYRWFPDTNHPIVNFQKGEFCASEEEYSITELYRLQHEGEIAGVEHIEAFPSKLEDARGGATRWSVGDAKQWGKFDPAETGCQIPALVTKVQVKLVPSKFELEEGKKLGPEEFPVLYIVWYANDNRLIRLEPAYAWHNEFSWSVAQFTPDMHRTLNLGLADLISQLQSVISWYVNSHITSVRRVIANRLIVDPKVIDTKSLDGEGDIYMRKSVSVPLERAVGQLRVQDVTSGHMADAEVLNKIIELVTGVNGNAMGQYNGGRRSAQESRVVTAGAASRMKLHGHLIWESCFGRMGKHMLSNLRQALSFESFERVIGKGLPDIEERFLTFQGTPEEVICGDDYMVFDSTLASEKGFMAQSIQELLSIIMSNPAAAQMFDISPKGLVEEMFSLRGTGNLRRFSMSERIKAGKDPMPVAPTPPVVPPAA